MAFEKGHKYGGKKKGLVEYRASLTRTAYEKNPEKCLKVILNIIQDAENGDPVCRKIFATHYMTKAPDEMYVYNDDGDITERLHAKGLNEAEILAVKTKLREKARSLLDVAVDEVVQERGDENAAT